MNAYDKAEPNVIQREFMMNLNFSGIIIGISTFLIIAIARYACIKGEYYFSKKFWIVFLTLGIGFLIAALLINELLVACIMAIAGFSFLWGIGEIIEQEERVKKGWFPKKPKKNNICTPS